MNNFDLFDDEPTDPGVGIARKFNATVGSCYVCAKILAVGAIRHTSKSGAAVCNFCWLYRVQK